MEDIGRYESLLRAEAQQKGTLVAALIDPDSFAASRAREVAGKVQQLGASMIFIGGSTITDQTDLDKVVIQVKKQVTIPVILFPGNITGISRHADAILFSSLLNSSNPYFIIGAQALGAPQVMKYGLEAIPMGYLVFGKDSATGFVGEVKAIPPNKSALAVMYALAAQYLGMRSLYLEGGSGSKLGVPADVVKAVRKYFRGLLIVGGGITHPGMAQNIAKAGADIIVIGNLLETRTYESMFSKLVRAVKDARL